MRGRHSPGASSAAFALLLLCAAPSSALTQVSVFLDVVTIEGGSLSNGDPTSAAPFGDTLSDTDTWGQAFATGTASYGQLSGDAQAEVQADDLIINGSYSASSRVGWRDDLTITPSDPLLDGANGFMTVSVLFDGALTATADLGGFLVSSAGWSATVFTTFGQADFAGSESSDGTATGDALGLQVIVLPIVFGFEMNFGVIFTGDVSVQVNRPPVIQTALANTAFGNTVSWGGIQAVTDEFGTPVDFVASSGSGTDWAVPVPEPGAASLLAMGLLLLGAHRRR